MNNPASEHAGWFRDVRRILDVVEDVTENVPRGLALPGISSTRAVFDYRKIIHAQDAAEAVALAETILSHALGVTFVPRTALAGDDTARYILEGFMPSGLAVDIVAIAEHMAARPVPAQREDAGELVAA